MRRLALITAAVVATLIEAAPAVARRIPMPTAYRCTNGTWPELEKCIRKVEPSAKFLRATTPKSRLVTLYGDQRLLFVQLANGRWQNAGQLGDPDYTIVEERTIEVGTRSALRLELRHHVAIGRTAMLVEKLAYICSDLSSCQRLVYSCIVTSRGKAIETFLGDIEVRDDGTVAVTGDRSQSGAICLHR